MRDCGGGAVYGRRRRHARPRWPGWRWSTPASSHRLVVVLIRPSRYDDEGYVVRHWRGTLPSNTLSCLHSLTEDAVASGAFGAVKVRVEVIDEIVSRVDPAAIGRRFRRSGTKVVVGLVGVQTNQLPRAQDLAAQFRAEGFDVIIGGFHVSGAMALADGTPPECQALLDAGVTLVLGEVEGRWAGILRDALDGRLRPIYDFLGAPPELGDMPLPRASRSTQRRFVTSRNATIDAGRGCPFSCSFCTIINVQGRKMRSRNAAHILEQVRANYHLKGGRGVSHYFFTDDNFARNPQWEAIFDGLIALRDDEGLDIDFMMQVDTQAARIPRFVEKAARAGCVQVFIGVESVRDDNLAAGGKAQNRVADYAEMVARWHSVGVVCHAGVIIGFPHDTYDRVMEDVRALAEDMRFDQASFFMMTPLPGSRDHQAAVRSGVALDTDYNNYDASHAAAPHPRMSAAEWTAAFHDAWAKFYSTDHMRRVLIAQNPHTYWGVLKTLLWYRAGMIEGAHPMVTGFFRLKDRTSRRPTFPVERRWPFYRRRAREIAHMLREYLKLYFEMQDLWLQTRIRRDDYWFLGDLRKLSPSSVRELKLAWGRLHTTAASRLAALQVRVGDGVSGLSARMTERFDVVREAVGVRAAALRSSMAEGAARAFERESAASIADRMAGQARAVRAALANLSVPGLPAVRSRSRLLGWFKRVNPLSMERLEYSAALEAYWLSARRMLLRMKFWRLNPLRLAWNSARLARRTLLFFVAMRGEQY